MKSRVRVLFNLPLIIVFLGCIIRIAGFINNSYNISEDECFSVIKATRTFGGIFFQFEQGSNFLPLYGFILKIIYVFFGPNWALFKAVSLIGSILSLFVFKDVLCKLIENKLQVITGLCIFTFSSSLIFYSFQIKPYIIEVLISCLLINAILDIKKNDDISIKKLILYIISSVVIIFISIPSIVIIEVYWCILFFQNLFEKKISNIYKLIIFQCIAAGMIIYEYFTYIIQIVQDNGLKVQWTLQNGFFPKPDNLKALNALVNSWFFDVAPFDTWFGRIIDKPILILLLFLFISGSLSLILNRSLNDKNERKIGLYIISPVYVFLILSLLDIYPFCNRVVLFLVPFIIIILLKGLDTTDKLFNNNPILTISVLVFFFCQVSPIESLLSNFQPGESYKKDIELLENTDNETLVISNEGVCSRCLKNKNIKIIQENIRYDKITKNHIISCLDRNKNETENMPAAEFFNGREKIAFVDSHNYDEETLRTSKIMKEIILKNGYKQEQVLKSSNNAATFFTSYTLYSKK